MTDDIKKGSASARYTYRAISLDKVQELVFDEKLSIIMDKLADRLVGDEDTAMLVITKREWKNE